MTIRAAFQYSKPSSRLTCSQKWIPLPTVFVEEVSWSQDVNARGGVLVLASQINR